MAKAYGVHDVQLKSGVSAEQLERFLREEWRPADIPGVRQSWLKGDRGDRAGTYLRVFEFESKETRDRYFPTLMERSAEFERVRERSLNTPDQVRIRERLSALVEPREPGKGFTDWVTIAE